MHYTGRSEALNQSRTTKMARSAHAYVRGNTTKFYDWLALETPGLCRRRRRSGFVVTATSATWVRLRTETAASTSRFATLIRRSSAIRRTTSFG
jgi:hypothetical protein